MHTRLYAVNTCPKCGKQCTEECYLVEAVVGPSEEDAARYQQFLKEVTNFYKQLGVEMYQPLLRVRKGRTVLVPTPTQDPCTVCKDAEYNRNCQRTKECAPLIYHNLNRLNALLPRSEKCSATPASEPGPTPAQKPVSSAGKPVASKRTTSSDRHPRKLSAKLARRNSHSRKPSKNR